MQTRRDYAVSLGLATHGRGRMSKAAHEAINKAVADGMQFSDMPGTMTENTKPVKSEDVSKVDKNTAENYFGATPDKIYNGGWYILSTEGKKISIGGKEVCRNCMTSLDWHRCDSPIIPNASGEMVMVMR